MFGARVAKDIVGADAGRPAAAFEGEIRTRAGVSEAGAGQVEQQLRAAMSAGAGVIRDEASLRHTLAEICELERQNAGDRRVANMLTTAKLIAAAALERRESRGAHFRSDYPTPDQELARRSFFTLRQADRIAQLATGPGQARDGQTTVRAMLHA